MLKCIIITIDAEVLEVKIWNGSEKDISNFATDKYLQINSCGFENVAAEHTLVRQKGRVDYHILLINSGVCEAMHRGKLYTLNAGDLIIYEPGEEQKYTFKTESTSLWCHFTGKIVKELFDSCNLTGGVYFLSASKTIFETYSTLIQRFNQKGRKRMANASLLELIYNISDAITSPKQIDNSEFILPILTYINANYNKKITLDELAQKSGYSKSRFSHIFSEVTQTTPIKYQNGIRLKLSCEMLLSTDYSITDIASSCGFADPLYFSRIFKKKYNVTPSEYRASRANV